MSTDFREYSAAFHDHQNDLMHYGVKGMTWDPSKRRRRGQTDPTGGYKAKMTVSDVYGDKKDHDNATRLAPEFNKLRTGQLKEMLDKPGSHPAEEGLVSMILDRRSSGEDKKRGNSTMGSIVESAKKKKSNKSVTSVLKNAKRSKDKEKSVKEAKRRRQAHLAERAYRRGGH